MQQAKIENSERDESRVDTKKWRGGGRGELAIHELKFQKKCQQDQNRQVPLINTLTCPLMPINRNNYPWLSFNDLEDFYTAECFKYIDF